jgi:hypothetical protein
MTVRKGQFIINYLSTKLKIPDGQLGRYLFKLSDEEFEEIEHEYRKYIIPRIHDPNEWQGELQPIGKALYEGYRNKQKESSSRKPRPSRKKKSVSKP